MDAHTDANNTIRSHHTDMLKLRVVNHKYAAQIAVNARTVERHVRKLVLLHAKIKAEAMAIVSPDYDKHHAVGFEETASSCAILRPAARNLGLALNM
jgi:hypothetical protein